jgi:hypothetical protein
MAADVAVDREAYDEALDHVERARKISMDQWQSHTQRGEYIDNDSDLMYCFVRAGYLLADILEDRGEVAAARDIDLQVYGMTGRTMEGWFFRFAVYNLEKGDVQLALTALRDSIKRDRDEFWVYRSYPWKRRQRAMKMLIEQLEKCGTPEALKEARERREQARMMAESEEELRVTALEEARRAVAHWVEEVSARDGGVREPCVVLCVFGVWGVSNVCVRLVGIDRCSCWACVMVVSSARRGLRDARPNEPRPRRRRPQGRQGEGTTAHRRIETPVNALPPACSRSS